MAAAIRCFIKHGFSINNATNKSIIRSNKRWRLECGTDLKSVFECFLPQIPTTYRQADRCIVGSVRGNCGQSNSETGQDWDNWIHRDNKHFSCSDSKETIAIIPVILHLNGNPTNAGDKATGLLQSVQFSEPNRNDVSGYVLNSTGTNPIFMSYRLLYNSFEY